MVNITAIEWTALFLPDGSVLPGYTSNPLFAVNVDTGKRGWFCAKCSPVCLHCYAERLNVRFGNGLRFLAANLERIEWKLNEKELQRLVKLGRRKPGSRVFVGDMLDLFHPAIPKSLLRRGIEVLCREECRSLALMLLTKRPECALEFFRTEGIDLAEQAPNILFGASAENQTFYDERRESLELIPSAKIFWSLEPLLGPIDLGLERFGRKPDWIIAGAESRCGAREMNEQWVREIKDQCERGGIPFFFKQAAERGRKLSLPLLDGSRRIQYPCAAL